MLPTRARRCYSRRVGTIMDTFLIGLAGGCVPGVFIVIAYLCTLAGRLAKVETNISWLIKELRGCQLRSKDRIR